MHIIRYNWLEQKVIDDKNKKRAESEKYYMYLNATILILLAGVVLAYALTT